MTFINTLEGELTKLVGYAGPQPHTAVISGPDGVTVSVDFTAVDRMSCSFSELRLQVPSLAGAGIDELKAWADALARRITYLLENIGPVELDPNAGQVLIRSNPPDRQSDATRFYEILLQSRSNGNFLLKRYISEKGTPGRSQVDVQVTHEVLKKLVRDLVETIPAGQS